MNSNLQGNVRKSMLIILIRLQTPPGNNMFHLRPFKMKDQFL